ncbi:MAG: sulfotransferase family protein [Panacagrimonas sp.]
MTAKARCIILLSEKSSGSSAVQRLLAESAGVRCVTTTRHFENETLYWTKAASMLSLQQVPMLDSEVPMVHHKARADLLDLLRENLPDYAAHGNDREIVMDGWRRLCLHYGPIFFEKSPHHLLQWSNLELIVQAIRELPDIEFLLLGLVRHPIDTAYSQFTRWGTRPEDLQYQWMAAYRNLLRLKDQVGDAQLSIVRYEDVVTDNRALEVAYRFCGVAAPQEHANGGLHDGSVAKWKRDRRFGFVLDPAVAELARQFGYEPSADSGFSSPQTLAWLAYRERTRAWLRAKSMASPLLRMVRGY